MLDFNGNKVDYNFERPTREFYNKYKEMLEDVFYKFECDLEHNHNFTKEESAECSNYLWESL